MVFKIFNSRCYSGSSTLHGVDLNLTTNNNWEEKKGVGVTNIGGLGNVEDFQTAQLYCFCNYFFKSHPLTQISV